MEKKVFFKVNTKFKDGKKNWDVYKIYPKRRLGGLTKSLLFYPEAVFLNKDELAEIAEFMGGNND